MELEKYIRDIPDFPKPGIVFKDISPLLADPKAFSYLLEVFAQKYKDCNVTKVCGIEARGFIFGAALAQKMGVGFVPIRKAGKLPYKTFKREYALEYGTDCIEVHQDAVKKGEKVLLIDDLVATGGTALAAVELLEEIGADLVAVAFVIELTFLKAADKFDSKKYFSLLKY